MNFSFAHEFDIDVAGFWKVFFSDEFSTELYKQLAMKSRTVSEFKDDGKTLTRVQKLEPSTPLPGWAQSVIGDISYVERNKLDWSKNAMDVVIEPVAQRERIDFKGVFAVTPLGDKRCKRTFEGSVKISIPFLGGRIEKYMMEQVRDGYDTAAKVTKQFIDKAKGNA